MTSRINPGILYAVVAYTIWGLLPAFLKLLAPLPAPDILAHRILWSLLLLVGLALALRHGPALRRIVTTPRLMFALTASATLIADRAIRPWIRLSTSSKAAWPCGSPAGGAMTGRAPLLSFAVSSTIKTNSGQARVRRLSAAGA